MPILLVALAWAGQCWLPWAVVVEEGEERVVDEWRDTKGGQTVATRSRWTASGAHTHTRAHTGDATITGPICGQGLALRGSGASRKGRGTRGQPERKQRNAEPGRGSGDENDARACMRARLTPVCGGGYLAACGLGSLPVDPCVLFRSLCGSHSPLRPPVLVRGPPFPSEERKKRRPAFRSRACSVRVSQLLLLLLALVCLLPARTTSRGWQPPQSALEHIHIPPSVRAACCTGRVCHQPTK
ncbi:hypothetical protein BOTBODRAFT_26849 [Botryobasidium botryosum FD-172 SS1]|uniref:CBM1 domain-containing protein n=1 Tax=Botryobasidium botryosum (strain FD-172 SS1) TaxID=930990 RepID=A0A067N1M8_BOTB1|nr:hypothetical protein BOTBODRAFT_26849 [Botryobasidium botryosum FD-172 SS1]